MRTQTFITALSAAILLSTGFSGHALARPKGTALAAHVTAKKPAKATKKVAKKPRFAVPKSKGKGKKGKAKAKHHAFVMAKPDPHAPPLDPFRVEQSYDEIREAIRMAKLALISAPIGTDVIGARHAVLAVWSPGSGSNAIRMVYVRDGTSQTLGFDVQVQSWNGLSIRPDTVLYNGVNTYYKITGTEEAWYVLAIKTNTKRQHGAIYVPYNPAYQTEDVVEHGRQYMRDVLRMARHRLTEAHVRSLADPDAIVTETVDEKVLFTLQVIEHTDIEESVTRGAPWVAEKMFTTMALNREETYRNAISSAGAMGIAQFMPRTYGAMRKLYPEANLPASFEDAMLNHVTAAMAQYCLADYSLSRLVQAGVTEPKEPELLGAYLAAAYNGGEGRAVPAFKAHLRACHTDKDGRQWCDVDHGLADETRNYVRKFAETYEYLFPDEEDDEATPPAIPLNTESTLSAPAPIRLRIEEF
ncbi:MAG: hypothetical protein RLZZ324_619 [Candidatus Parcubacteria bacterium]